ncbi:threonine dehydratase [Hypnocyclicus thermotrophus]|uniref:threonine ammonia-lyase n=1 Tax=Hypnocyclicus thermotrophus TaxID=1627895 RepID=A0AA46DX29_9FUSO|nr:threonine ammonia-lyase [Hypnocyclicus thermotrophus]TDT67439.1 threonine dehydratase [Hypnocyclicus thermotrophus]
MFTLKDFTLAENRLKNIIKETRLIYSPAFSEESQNEIFIKPENLQKTGAFKIRGAYNKIALLSDEEKKRGLIASSAGNHAQGVAFAAQQLGVPATIVMPKTTPLIKIEATKKYGAKVVLAGDVYDEAYEEAMRLQKENNYTFIHPFNDKDIIIGQGTIGLEIFKELPDTDVVLVPVGGGGLIAGVAAAIKLVNPHIKIVGVEPEGAASMLESFKNDKITKLENTHTIADGTAVKEVGELTFNLCKKYVDEIITVSDYELMEAFLILVEKHKIIAENSGLLSLAGIKRLNVKNKKIVCVVSGGNIDVLTISSLITKGLVSRGRIFRFSITLNDRPGELLLVSDILAKQNANVIKLDHNQFKNLDRFTHVELEVTVETNGERHIQEIIKAFAKKGYSINKVE